MTTWAQVQSYCRNQSGRNPLRVLQLCLLVVSLQYSCRAVAVDERLQFFEQKIRPVLVQHCYGCHSAEAQDLQGGLRLDLRAGWQQGGESGRPVIVPGDPAASSLLLAMQHERAVSSMPPDQPRLSAAVLADFTQWIRDGAVDPRDGAVPQRDRQLEWEAEYQRRLDWWSLRRPQAAPVPQVQ
ncbi:MAG TPA: hypothetical protein DCX79_07570, partial [Planctomycetaceae bacterium]|nr:hypothetical protein [Planctomycetaceae bacterium]